MQVIAPFTKAESVADLGSGSGIFSLAAALVMPSIRRVTALDINENLLAVHKGLFTRTLSARHSLDAVKLDVFNPKTLPFGMDLVICNPPWDKTLSVQSFFKFCLLQTIMSDPQGGRSVTLVPLKYETGFDRLL